MSEKDKLWNDTYQLIVSIIKEKGMTQKQTLIQAYGDDSNNLKSRMNNTTLKRFLKVLDILGLEIRPKNTSLIKDLKKFIQERE